MLETAMSLANLILMFALEIWSSKMANVPNAPPPTYQAAASADPNKGYTPGAGYANPQGQPGYGYSATPGASPHVYGQPAQGYPEVLDGKHNINSIMVWLATTAAVAAATSTTIWDFIIQP